MQILTERSLISIYLLLTAIYISASFERILDDADMTTTHITKHYLESKAMSPQDVTSRVEVSEFHLKSNKPLTYAHQGCFMDKFPRAMVQIVGLGTAMDITYTISTCARNAHYRGILL